MGQLITCNLQKNKIFTSEFVLFFVQVFGEMTNESLTMLLIGNRQKKYEKSCNNELFQGQMLHIKPESEFNMIQCGVLKK